MDPSGFGFNDKEVPKLFEGKYCGVGISKCVKTIDGIGRTPTLAVVVDCKSALSMLLFQLNKIGVYWKYSLIKDFSSS